MLVKSILQKKKKREKKKEEAGEGREEEKRGGRREERSERRVCVRVRACACESVCLLVRVRVARADHERERDRKRGVHVARACMGAHKQVCSLRVRGCVLRGRGCVVLCCRWCEVWCAGGSWGVSVLRVVLGVRVCIARACAAACVVCVSIRMIIYIHPPQIMPSWTCRRSHAES